MGRVDSSMRAAIRWVLVASLCVTALGCARDWEGHDAYTSCSGALRGYPWAPSLDCRGVSVCANEAVLSTSDQARIRAIGRRLGCEP